MAQTKIIRIIQTWHVDHNETIERSWYDVVERTIERSLDTEGNILSDEMVDETVVETGLDVEEETIATDEDTEPDEMVEEVFEDED